MDLKQLEYFVNVVDLGGFSRAGRAARHRPAGDQPADPQPRGGAAPEPAAAQRAGRHADRSRQAPARARARHPAAGRPGAARGRRDQGCAGRPRRRRAAADGRAAPDACRSCASSGSAIPGGSLSIVEGLSATIHEWLLVGRVDVGVVYNPVAVAGGRRAAAARGAALPHRPPGGRARGTRTLRLRDLPRYPLIIPEPAARDPDARRDPARGRSACGRRSRWRSTRCRRSSSSSPRATASRCCRRGRSHGADAARRLCARAIVQPRLDEHARHRHVGAAPVDADPAARDRADRAAHRAGPRASCREPRIRNPRATIGAVTSAPIATPPERMIAVTTPHDTAVPRRSRRQLPAPEIPARRAGEEGPRRDHARPSCAPSRTARSARSCGCRRRSACNRSPTASSAGRTSTSTSSQQLGGVKTRATW